MKSCRTAVLIGFAALVLPGGTMAQDPHDHPAGDAGALGRVEFPTSCAPATAPTFERAVAALHSFWLPAADSLFSAVIAADPTCALAYWGRAMTLLGNPMTRAAPAPPVLEEGGAMARRARELSASLPERERMFVAAATVYYEGSGTHLERMLAMEHAFEALHRAYPDDREAAVFLGRAMVANADPADASFERLLRGAELLEPLFASNPDHPGLAHYLIHAYDVPQLADRGLDAARVYADIAPAAPHALHMPSHIFTRLGYWDESIEMNARSAAAEPNPDAAVHPLDYQVYAYLQQGRDAEARAVLERSSDAPDRFYGMFLGYNFAAMPARYALEREDWEAAAALRVPADALPYVEALTRFARAVGAARSGAPANAAKELERLAELKQRLDEQRDEEWAVRVEAQRLAAEAWMTFARGHADEALRIAAAAADLEDTIEKSPVTPGPLLPARELWADMLLELDRPAEAQREYEQTLQREPRRRRALYGAARAAELAGDAAAARSRYTELLEVLSKAESGRADVAAARRFLARGS